MVRVGIVGLGGIAGKVYLPLLSADPKVEIVGIASRRTSTVDQIGDQYRIPHRFTDLGELLARSPDVVFVHTPTETHAEIVTACLERGAHVYVDKPLSYELAESEAMVAAAARHRRLLAVGFNRRFAPLNRMARDWIADGGGLEVAATSKHRTAPQHSSARITVYDDLIHIVDLLVWLAGGEAEAVHYQQRADADGRLVDAVGTLSGADLTGQFAMSRRAGANTEHLALHGHGRSAEVNDLESLVLSADGEQQVRGFGSWETVLRRRGFADAVDHVLACLDHPETCELSGERVLPTHRLTEHLLNLS